MPRKRSAIVRSPGRSMERASLRSSVDISNIIAARWAGETPKKHLHLSDAGNAARYFAASPGCCPCRSAIFSFTAASPSSRRFSSSRTAREAYVLSDRDHYQNTQKTPRNKSRVHLQADSGWPLPFLGSECVTQPWLVPLPSVLLLLMQYLRPHPLFSESKPRQSWSFAPERCLTLRRMDEYFTAKPARHAAAACQCPSHLQWG